jgi:ornithine cyclodeaminase
MLVLSNKQVGELLSPRQIIDAVEQAIVAYENNTVIVPKRIHIDNGKNTLLCMPSWGADSFATKLVAVAPDNVTKNLPVTNGAMLLNDGATGMPLALINASKLTALRTGAVGAVGVRLTTPETETSFGLIGCGVQGTHQAIFACAVHPINTVYYFDPAEARVSEMVSLFKTYHPNVKLVRCASGDEVVQYAAIIVTATTSTAPVFTDDEGLVRGRHFISIGSYKPSMQELPNSVYKLAKELSIDSEFAKAETGDIINPIKNGLIKEDQVYTIGKLLMGKRKLEVNKTTVFKSTGMALFDLYVAEAMYREAVRKNVGTEVEF